MTAVVIQIRDYHLKKLEKKAAEVMSQVIDYTELAKLGGPVVEVLEIDWQAPYMLQDKDPA